jgi:hypothetical protein
LSDFFLAEAKAFPDMYSLLASRGMVYRLLRQSENAEKDFIEAAKYIPDDNKVSA